LLRTFFVLRAIFYSQFILHWLIQQIESIVEPTRNKFFYWVGCSSDANESWGTFGALKILR